MAYVKVFRKDETPEERNEALERALRAFKHQVAKEGIIKDLHSREEYLPPSVKKRNKRKESIKRARRLAAKRRRFNKDK